MVITEIRINRVYNLISMFFPPYRQYTKLMFYETKNKRENQSNDVIILVLHIIFLQTQSKSTF